MRHVKVEYIESGTFQGGEEDTFKAGIKYNEKCVVIKKKDFDRIQRLEKYVQWFRSYPEYVPNPEKINKVVKDRDAAFGKKNKRTP